MNKPSHAARGAALVVVLLSALVTLTSAAQAEASFGGAGAPGDPSSQTTTAVAATKPAPAASPGRDSEAAAFADRVDGWMRIASGVKQLCRGANDDERTAAAEASLTALLDKPAAEAQRALLEANAEKAAAAGGNAAEIEAAEKKVAAKQATADEIEHWRTLSGMLPSGIVREQLVPAICYAFGNDKAPLDVRPFADRSLAAAAVVVDPDAVMRVARVLRESLGSLEEINLALIERSTVPLARIAFGAYRTINTERSAPSLDLAASAVDLAVKGLAGLAKLIADRAQFEAVGWFLEQLGERLCDTSKGGNPRVKREMRRHFLPSMCALASENELWEYGAGAALWRSLRVSAVEDFRGLPGAGVGLASLTLLDDPGKWVGCNPSDGTTGAKCVAANALRHASEARTAEILDGRNPAAVLARWADDLMDLKTTHGTAMGTSDAYEQVACAASVPGVVSAWSEGFRHAKVAQPGASLGVAAVSSTRACLAVHHVEGIERACIDNLLTARTACDTTKGTRQNHELLTNLAAHAKAKHLEKARALESSAERFARALATFEKLLSATPEDPPQNALQATLQINADTDPDNVEAAVAALASSAAVDAAPKRKIAALFEVADASLELAERSAALVAELATAAVGGAASVKDVVVAIGRLRQGMALARSAALGEWAKLARDIVVTAQRAETEGWFAGSKDAQKVLVFVRAHAKDLAALAAIASAKDGDEMAEALDALADPPGGWRSKRHMNQDTVSITAHAGFYGALELRHGNYGVIQERGGDVYWQPPALALPLGLEYARGLGTSSFNLFVSVIDPAAFLAYDAANGGRLPGPSVLTALAPGIEIGFALGDTPFNIGSFFVFRPGYRQWKGDADGAGAHALQFGTLLSVDVTLMTLFTRGDP